MRLYVLWSMEHEGLQLLSKYFEIHPLKKKEIPDVNVCSGHLPLAHRVRVKAAQCGRTYLVLKN